jgi:hypothetical protein
MKKAIKIFVLMLMLAALLAIGAYASGEPSDEASAEPAEPVTSQTTIIYGGQTYVLDVYEIDGVEYVKLADAEALLTDNDIALDETAGSGEVSGEASGEPSGEMAEAEASGEPSGEIAEAEASGEPSGEMAEAAASGEPSGEMAEAEERSFDVTFRINGQDYQTAAVGITAEDDTYTFQISALMDLLGIQLTYDEQEDVAYLTAQSDGLLAALMQSALTVAEQGASGEPEEPAEAPAAEEAAEPAAEETAQDDGVPATDGTENQQNVLDTTAAPETEEQFEAYKDYLTAFITDYAGVGDGTFDDGARDMALGELSGVGFGADVNAFPFEMFVSQFGALDYGAFAQTTG